MDQGHQGPIINRAMRSHFIVFPIVFLSLIFPALRGRHLDREASLAEALNFDPARRLLLKRIDAMARTHSLELTKSNLSPKSRPNRGIIPNDQKGKPRLGENFASRQLPRIGCEEHAAPRALRPQAPNAVSSSRVN
jgi:hypothetical protein